MSGDGDRKKLAIIDGKSVFYRGYYAMPNLSTKDGTPTGGVYGFAVMALEVIRRLKPDYVAVAWDKPKTNIRKRIEMYPAYKAGRKPAPPDFKVQIPILHKLLDAFGWPLYELDDYEADDIMGALAEQAKEKDIETLLITSDLDALQLVNSHTHVYALKKGLSNIELFKRESFEEKYGIKPEQFLDLKALMGDSSDNIPGVGGVGKKTAVDLLNQFESLDGVYENLGLIKDSVRKKLEADKDNAYLSKKLAALWTDAPVKLNLKDLDMANCHPEKVREELQKLEFRSLVRQLPEVMKVSGTTDTHENGDFKVGKNVVIDSDKDLDKLDMDGVKEVVMSSRVAGAHGQDPKILLLSPNAATTYALQLGKINAHKLKERLERLESIVGYDTKSTIKVLIELGAQVPKVAHDVQIGAFLVNSLRRLQNLTELAGADLGYEGSSLDELDDDEFVQKAPEITGAIRALHKNQKVELEKLPKVKRLAEDVEWPVIPVLAWMERRGIKLDVHYMAEMNGRISDMISDLEQTIYGYADEEFNVGSPQQLADTLFNKLDLPKQGIKKGKTGFSTAASELDKLRGTHPIIDLISQWREVSKLKNTYVDTLPDMVDENSRIHTTYNLTIAQTGRLSSTDPNLQNIPVRTKLGKEIRTAFIAEEGNMLVSADYSQQELRLAAYLSDDDQLIDMFNRDVDVHVATAAQIYGRDPEDITKNMRRDAKVVNFGVMYGLSPHGLSSATGMNHEQAKHFIDKYFNVRPKLQKYIESVKEKAKNDGYVETIMGRRRPTPDVHSGNFAVREAAFRAAVNMPFQGSAADIMKLAMVKVNEKLRGTDCKILLQIHDSLIVECPEEKAEETAKTLKEVMEGAYELPIKQTVDTEIGKNWGQL